MKYWSLIILGIIERKFSQNIDTEKSLEGGVSQIKKVFRDFYQEHIIFSQFCCDDWISYISALVFFLLSGWFFYYCFNEFFHFGMLLYDDNITSDDRQVLENSRAILGVIISLSAAIAIFFFNSTISVFSDVKNRQESLKINKKMDSIIEKLNNMEKK